MKRSISLGSAFSIALLLTACGGGEHYPQTPPVILGPHQVMVGPDDTIYRIAYQHGVSTKALIDVNRLKPPYIVSSGQILVLPDPLKDATPTSIEDPQPTEQEEMDSLKPLPLTAIPHEAEEGDHPRDGLKTSGEKQPLRQENVLPESPKSKTSLNKGSDVKSQFIWPVQGNVVGKFGKGKGKGQDGIRIAAPLGTEVKSIAAGKVIYVGNEIPNLGKLILVQHKNGWISAYGHLKEKTKVAAGTSVSQGMVLGHVGKTGAAKAPQLYFELREKKKPVDPLPILGHKG